MDDNFNLKRIEDNKEDEEKMEDEVSPEAFVTGLPDWDLEPLNETLNRGNKQWHIMNGLNILIC